MWKAHPYTRWRSIRRWGRVSLPNSERVRCVHHRPTAGGWWASNALNLPKKECLKQLKVWSHGSATSHPSTYLLTKGCKRLSPKFGLMAQGGTWNWARLLKSHEQKHDQTDVEGGPGSDNVAFGGCLPRTNVWQFIRAYRISQQKWYKQWYPLRNEISGGEFDISQHLRGRILNPLKRSYR